MKSYNFRTGIDLVENPRGRQLSFEGSMAHLQTDNTLHRESINR